MAEYSEFGFGMRLDANLPRLNAGITLPKKEIPTPEQALQSIRSLLRSRPDVGKYSFYVAIKQLHPVVIP